VYLHTRAHVCKRTWNIYDDDDDDSGGGGGGGLAPDDETRTALKYYYYLRDTFLCMCVCVCVCIRHPEGWGPGGKPVLFVWCLIAKFSPDVLHIISCIYTHTQT